ncbi:hypothetical protein [Candidatus Spongiihabitans sp.]|uniref:hypothetical protein n=1 Tax=Candidatus Spongiihabitans sp. TaxID=3101308 RepID=UPI003C705AB8
MLLHARNLPYGAGNAGDLVKHGALAVFVKWFLKTRNNIRCADSFGGSQRHNLVGKEEFCRRLKILSGRVHAFADAQPDWERKNDYGSSRMVWNIAHKSQKTADIFAPDTTGNPGRSCAESYWLNPYGFFSSPVNHFNQYA